VASVAPHLLLQFSLPILTFSRCCCAAPPTDHRCPSSHATSHSLPCPSPGSAPPRSREVTAMVMVIVDLKSGETRPEKTEESRGTTPWPFRNHVSSVLFLTYHGIKCCTDAAIAQNFCARMGSVL
jgi:hypothetical protein